MDTPTRSKNSQIGSSIGKFEESPVFDFLNSLSPIKPVKSQHITQTFNPLSFVSLPSVFTSPHVRSLKECRLLRRQQLSDPSKPEFSSDKINLDAINEQKENLNPGSGNDETAGEPPSYESLKNINEVAESQNYECSSPKSNIRPLCALKAKNNTDYCGSSLETIRYVEESSQRSLYGGDNNQIDQSKDGSTCDWENMISDPCDLLIFESPDDKGSYKNSIDQGTNFYGGMNNEIQSSCSMGALVTDVGEGHEQEQHMSTQPGEGIEMIEDSEFHDLVGASMNNPNEKMELENLPGFYRGMRRRCLVYEMAGARRNRTDESSISDTSLLLQSEGNTSFNSQHLVPAKTGDDTSSSCPLPSIGLHLNALASTTPKTYKTGNNEASASTSVSARVLIGPSSSVDFHHSVANSQDFSNITLAVSLQMREFDQQHGGLPMEDACDVSAYDMVNEEISPNSPKKKRRRPEQSMEGETTCKRCNCKKSKCLKLYCECFAAGVYCVEPCACIDCFNKPIHEDTVLATRKQIESRNPLAFAPKVIRGSESVPDIGDDFSKTPASARHKRGCNCKKSGCLKKYCECYQGGVGCSINCRCEGCKNAFGRKDGSSGIEAEVEFEDDETNITESSQNGADHNEFNQSTEPIAIATPLQPVRYGQQSFSTSKKPPRTSFSSFGSSSAGYVANEQAFNKPSLFQHPPKYDNHFETVGEDEIPEFLQRSSPVSGVKSLSPNQKRISPPHSAGMSSALRSPGLRSSRKLILQSIPSFPSLAPNQ